MQILRRHFARYTPEMVSQGVRLHARGADSRRRAAVRELRPRAHHVDRLRRRLDAAHDRRADHPHRRHPAAAARQHGPARRRHHGDARPLHHPGLDRRPDALRPAARLPAAADRRRQARDARRLLRERGHADRLLGQLPEVHRQPAQGVVRRRGDQGQRLRLRVAAAHRRRLLAAALLQPHGRTARSRATSCSARTPPAARPTPACTAPACASSTGWCASTGSRPRAPSSGRTIPNAPPPSEIKTEVFFIPAAASPEKEGTLTNTQRLLQWHDKAVDPPGDCRSDAWFVYHLGKRLKELYAGSTLAARPGAAGADLGLRARAPARAARRNAEPHRGRAGCCRRSSRRSTAASSTTSTSAPASRGCCPASAS